MQMWRTTKSRSKASGAFVGARSWASAGGVDTSCFDFWQQGIYHASIRASVSNSVSSFGVQMCRTM
jgi:hypothetical protein